MRRIERRLFEINDEISALRQAEELAVQELGFHKHLHDDASRDAVVSNSPIDRSDARETAHDVARFERHITQLRARRAKLEQRRTKLLAKL